MSSDSDSDSEQGAQIRVSLKLAASVQDRSLEVPSEPIAVPADIGRKGLAAVVNHLLGRSVAKDPRQKDDEDDDDDEESDSDDNDDKLPPLAFEFIVAGTNNRLLRKGLEKEARQYGISLEQAMAITYFPATSVPDLSEEHEQAPDWIGALSYNPSILCSGCYDGSLHLYEHGKDNTSLSKIHTLTVASGPIKALATKLVDDVLYIASSSLDHALNVHTYSMNHANDDDNATSVTAFGQCIQPQESAAVTSLDFLRATSSSKLLASGDVNGTICLWNLDQEENQDMATAGTSKKQKTTSTKSKPQDSIRQFQAQTYVESAHSQLVSGLSWSRKSQLDSTSSNSQPHLISGSWDHSIKLWDMERQDCLMTLNGSRVVSCLDTSYHTEGVVATGHPDCTIRLWDMRVNPTSTTKNNNNHTAAQAITVADTTFRPSHKAWVSSVQWCPSNAYHLASASHDGTVKLWDIRSSNPLHTVRAFSKEEKALCVVWAQGSEGDSPSLFAGGTDCTIKQLQM